MITAKIAVKSSGLLAYPGKLKLRCNNLNILPQAIGFRITRLSGEVETFGSFGDFGLSDGGSSGLLAYPGKLKRKV